MIDSDWLNDDRAGNPQCYLVPWNDPRSRQRAFLPRRTWYLRDGSHRADRVAWYSVGAFYARIVADIPVDCRRKLFYGALAQFVGSQRCAHWTDEERHEALQLARQAAGF